jgi:hypothetical protein
MVRICIYKDIFPGFFVWYSLKVHDCFIVYWSGTLLQRNWFIAPYIINCENVSIVVRFLYINVLKEIRLCVAHVSPDFDKACFKRNSQ